MIELLSARPLHKGEKGRPASRFAQPAVWSDRRFLQAQMPGGPSAATERGLFASRSNPVLIHTQYPCGPLDHPISSGGGGG